MPFKQVRKSAMAALREARRRSPPLRLHHRRSSRLPPYRDPDPEIGPGALQGPVRPAGRGGVQGAGGARRQHTPAPPVLAGDPLRPPPRGAPRPRRRP